MSSHIQTAATFPFSAVVGQDDAKLALLLNAIDPAIGGVLLRGQKGSAKSTLARGIAAVLPGKAPFVGFAMGMIPADPTIAAILGVAVLPADRDAPFPRAAIGERRYDQP